MKDQALYEKPALPDHNFPIRINCTKVQKQGLVFPEHWHEHIELLYFTEGAATIFCNSAPINVVPKTLIVANSNDLHSAENWGDRLEYYCIIIDPSLLKSSFSDICDVKYITPIAQNLIRFKNIIFNDKLIIRCINKVIKEHEKKELGYELAIKSSIYNLVVLLLRSYLEEIISPKEYELRKHYLERFKKVFEYIEQNYAESINIKQMADLSNLSIYRFCHLFKETTGKTLSDYINSIRVNKAVSFLLDTNMNITEVASSCGFSDANYFSRLFKKYKKTSPAQFRKKKF